MKNRLTSIGSTLTTLGVLSQPLLAHGDHTHPAPAAQTLSLNAALMSMTGFAPLSLLQTNDITHTSNKFRFVVIADTQQGATPGGTGIDAISPQIISDAAARNPLFTVFPGDLVGSGNRTNWNNWLTATAPLGDNRYIVPGNHDFHPTRGLGMKTWQEVFTAGLPWVDALADTVPPAGEPKLVGPLLAVDGSDHKDGVNDRRGVDYYVDHGNTRIISVSTDGTNNGTEATWNPPANLDWFRQVMTAPSTLAKENVIVFTHKPLGFDAFSNNSDGGGTAWTWWRSISGQDNYNNVDSRAADALFCGHYHLYRPGRPDAAKTQTMEIVVGTGGGGLEGRSQMRHHGFMEVFVDNDRITAWFWGDSDAAANGWSHTEVLDTIVIDPGTGNNYSGQLCRYDFESAAPLDDSSLDVTSKNYPLQLLGATVVDEGGDRGNVLVTGGNNRAHTSHIKDHNLNLTGDLTISLYAKADNASLTGDPGNNILVSYGAGVPDNYTGSSHTNFEVNGNERNEGENYNYLLSVNNDGKLRLAWQHREFQADNNPPIRDRGQRPYHPTTNSGSSDPRRVSWEVATSTVAVANLDQWNRIQVVRDSANKQVTFFLNGSQLGDPVAFTHHATGGQLGSLWIGASDRSLTGGTGGGTHQPALNDPNPGVTGWQGRIDDLQIFNNTSGTAGQMVGDFNFDSKVDLTDYSIIRKNLGTELDKHGNMQTFSKGDADFDGDVDADDIKRFKRAFRPE
jgi:hypothetical protein